MAFRLPKALTFLCSLPMVLMFIPAETVCAGETDDIRSEAFYRRHQAGLRVGVWGNLGGTPRREVSDSNSSFVFVNDFRDANFYLEGFAAYRFSRRLLGELSVGVVSRGEVTRRTPDASEYGNLLVYPILLKLKLYPLAPWSSRIHPYLTIGGGAYHARHDIQIISVSAYYNSLYEEESKTSVDYVIGAGVDWLVATTVGFEFSVQYMPIGFSRALIGVEDWSSLTFTVGAKYLFESKKK